MVPGDKDFSLPGLSSESDNCFLDFFDAILWARDPGDPDLDLLFFAADNDRDLDLLLLSNDLSLSRRLSLSFLRSSIISSLRSGPLPLLLLDLDLLLLEWLLDLLLDLERLDSRRPDLDLFLDLDRLLDFDLDGDLFPDLDLDLDKVFFLGGVCNFVLGGNTAPSSLISSRALPATASLEATCSVTSVFLLISDTFSFVLSITFS